MLQTLEWLPLAIFHGLTDLLPGTAHGLAAGERVHNGHQVFEPVEPKQQGRSL